MAEELENEVMKRILIYESGKLFGVKITGGLKRFLLLCSRFVGKEERVNGVDISVFLCCADDSVILSNYGLVAKHKMKSANGFPKVFLPELWYFLNNRDVIDDIKKQRYDAVIVFDVPEAIGLCLKRVKNITLMVRKDMIGYERVKNNNNAFKKSIKILIQWISEDIVLRRTKKIICQCQYDVNVLLSRHRYLTEKIKNKFYVQINNVNTPWIESNMDSEPLYRKNIGEFLIGFIGGFDDLRKGQDVFLEMANSIIDSQEHPEIIFITIGGGTNLDYYKKKYCSNRIKFLGHVENPIITMREFDLLIVPSLADSCPNTVLEGIYNSIIVLGSNRGGIPEILNNPDALFEPTVKDLCKKIRNAINNYEFRNQLLKKQDIRKKELTFDWERRIVELVIAD